MALPVSWPNTITIVRTLMIFVVVILAYGDVWWHGALAALVAILIIVGDWLDGHLARKLHQESPLGSVLDIAADRMFESVMWIVLADLGAVPVWIPIVVISRGILTDSIRGYALKSGHSGFGSHSLHKSTLGKFITGSPVMRTGYALLKAFSFGWLFLALAAREFVSRWGGLPPATIDMAFQLGYWSSVTAAVICLVRGIPVAVEGLTLIAREEPGA